jgi:hypothetical protein
MSSLTARAAAVAWQSSLTRLSTEIEGHPLGGGMLKLEPREAGQLLLAPAALVAAARADDVADGVRTMQRWRHHTGLEPS